MTYATAGHDSIEEQASRGGVMLLGRQVLGMGLSLASVIVITRMLGPRNYGLFAIANALGVLLSDVGRLGLDVFLIREPKTLTDDEVRVTHSLIATTSALISAGLLVFAPALASWYAEPQLLPLIEAQALIVPLVLFSALPMALLDRDLDFRRIARIELIGQLTNVAIAVPVIWLYHSVWGLVLGALGQALTLAWMTWASIGRWIGWQWNRREASRQLRYGCGYAGSIWIWQARTLVNPLIVGTLLGSEAVAFVAMAVRLTTTLSFATSAVWRVYMSLLARLANDRTRMRSAIETGMLWQTFLLCCIFVAFVGVSREIITGVMGARWLPVMQVLPFVAVAMIVNSGFSLYSSALYVIGAWRDIVVFHVLHVVLLTTAAAILVWWSGSIRGYGWAEIAACASYAYIRAAMHSRLFAVRETPLYALIAVAIGSIALSTVFADGPLLLRAGVGIGGGLILAALVPKEVRMSLFRLKALISGERSVGSA